jgi:16S rRNA (adenine1518-N6/adenine1519-N6)-dimethyltransferase
LKPIKALGQHFLHSEGVIARIVDCIVRLGGRDLQIVEFGPGPGALTAALLNEGFKIRAVEVDARMVDALGERFSEQIASGQLTVLHADALKLSGSDLASCQLACGNLPYNVGTEIVMRCFEQWPQLKHFCFMLQKEVVLRFMSQGNEADYGPLAVKTAWLCKPVEHFWVKPGAFSPPPKVDSGVFSLTRRANPALDPFNDRDAYLSVSQTMRDFFNHRRKMLRATDPRLKDHPWATRRPQELSPDDWIDLAKHLRNS